MNFVFLLLLVTILAVLIELVKKPTILLIIIVAVLATGTKGETMTNLEKRALEKQGLTEDLDDA